MIRTLVFDTEVYRNFFLVVFKDVNTGEIFSWEMAEGETLNRKSLARFMRKHRLISFNGINFDMVVLWAAIAGLPCEVIKDIANDIIVGDMKPWDIEDEYKFKIARDLDHTDLIEVAPGKASLKIYNGRLHGKRMQDLPIEPDAILTPKQMDQIYDYCGNDLDATELLFTSLTKQLGLRKKMSVEYGIDLRSKSDAQVAEAVIKSEVSAILGFDVKRPNTSPNASYRYEIADYIRFNGDDLNDILDAIEETKFRLSPGGSILMPKSLSDTEIKIGSGVYRMGIGGLHSSEKSASHVADENYILVDRDVASYYPAIIINQDLHPKHMGFAFQRVYQRIVKRRLKAKDTAKLAKSEIKELQKALTGSNRDGPSLMEERLAELLNVDSEATVTADSLKITINGSFGKFGNKWSALYSPQLLIQTTITGQLSLLMLIERLERRGIEVVSANTDGIVIKCHRDDVAAMDEVVAKWERDTNFETEATEYAALYSRDVNNYIAVKPDGTAKRKGAFAETAMMKNPTNEICAEAVVEFLTKGTPIHKTIRACRDVGKFVTVRTVNGGAVWGAREIEIERFGKTGKRLKSGIRYDLDESEYLGKAIRWIYSNEVEGAIHYKTNGNKVPRSDGARPVMELPDEIPEDIDYRWYVKEARSILTDIGYHKELF